MKKYKYYTQTNGWQEVIAESEPTTCYIDSSTAIGVYISDENPLVAGGIQLDNGLSLANYKQLRYNEIDGKTGAFIGTGFTYDSATFSASIHAQSNWSSIKENTSDYTFPLEISTTDNNGYSLTEANVTAFWTAGRDFVKSHLDSGRALKKSIFDAVDKAGVDAIVDNR